MTPIKLFYFFCAVGGGLFVIGFLLFVLFLLFAIVAAWARRTAPPEPEEPKLNHPYDERNVVLP